jgi:NADPH:quinone reductase-like Zn-dependent oxidoreductase
MASLSSTIKAVRQPDPRYQTLVLSDIPTPTLSGPDERLIRVRAAAPCRHELTWELSSADAYTDAPDDRLRVPCTECAGVVVASGATDPDSAPFKPGDEVFFRIEVGNVGCLRELTVARVAEMALKPKQLSWEEAAATPLSALTAWQGLFTHSEGVLDGKATRGDEEARKKNGKARVLITGAGGSVGGWAVQLAAAAGVGGIVALCGPSKEGFVRELGATETIDYTKQSIADWAAADPAARECDLVLDCVGGSTLAGCWAAVKAGGVLLTVSPKAGDALNPPPGARPVAKSAWFLVKALGGDLTEVAALMEEGRCVPLLDSVFAFEDYQAAFDKLEAGTTKGKCVIRMPE